MGRKAKRRHLSLGRAIYVSRRLQDKKRRRRVTIQTNGLIFAKLVGDGEVSPSIAGLEMLSIIAANSESVGFSEMLYQHLQIDFADPEQFYILPRGWVDYIVESWRKYRTYEANSLDEAFRLEGAPSNRSPRRILDDLAWQFAISKMLLDHLSFHSSAGRPISLDAAIEWVENELKTEPVEISKKSIHAAWRKFGPFLEQRLAALESAPEAGLSPLQPPTQRD